MQKEAGGYEPQTAEEKEAYHQFLLNRLELLSDLSISVRKSYTENVDNRKDHYMLISLAVELWEQLYPKIQGTDLEQKFKKFMPFYINPRYFLLPKYENYIWLLIFEIRIAYEQLGLTSIK